SRVTRRGGFTADLCTSDLTRRAACFTEACTPLTDCPNRTDQSFAEIWGIRPESRAKMFVEMSDNHSVNSAVMSMAALVIEGPVSLLLHETPQLPSALCLDIILLAIWRAISR